MGMSFSLRGDCALEQLESRLLLSSSWEFVTPLSIERSGVDAALMDDGFIYAVGGQDANKNVLATAERYDPLADSWSAIAPMNQSRYVHEVINVDGLLYAIGGNDGKGAIASVEVYDPTLNEWSVLPSLNVGRHQFGTASDSIGNIYVFGGDAFDGTTLRSVEVLDTNNPSLGWQFLNHELHSPRLNPGGGVDSQGRIYAIAGAVDGSGESVTVERFDPDNPSLGWTLVSSITTASTNY